MAPTRASSQRPGLWKPLAPHALRAGFEATPGGGAFYGKTYSFDALSLTARSSFDSFDASCLFSSFDAFRLLGFERQRVY